MSSSKCRWGFVSTALIGQKNWQAIKNSSNGVVAAVASRTLNRANEFIELCQDLSPFPQRPQAYDSYDAIIDSDEIDAVYIPLPTGLRKQWVINAAKAGKHVLCEKPCAVSTEDLEEMISACRDSGVQFMDGVMYMHSARLPQVRQAIDDGTSVGEIKRITCQFSFFADEDWLDSNIRLNSDLEPHGCLGDLGWYCIRFALWTMNWQLPERVTATSLTERGRNDSAAAVPIEFSAELFFPGGQTANFYCSFVTHHQQWANISGTKGYIHLNDYVLPYRGDQLAFDISNAEFVVDGCDFYMKNHRQTITTVESGNSTENSMETNMFRNFANLVGSGEPDYHWADISLKTQQVMDACLSAARNEKHTVELVC